MSPVVSSATAIVDFVKTSVQYSVNNQSFAETLLYFTYPSHPPAPPGFEYAHMSTQSTPAEFLATDPSPIYTRTHANICIVLAACCRFYREPELDNLTPAFSTTVGGTVPT